MAEVQTWELWYPEAGNTGLPFARARLDPTELLWVHAAPPTLAVTVRQADERPVAHGEPLRRVGQRYPMTKLIRRGEQPRRACASSLISHPLSLIPRIAALAA